MFIRFLVLSLSLTCWLPGSIRCQCSAPYQDVMSGDGSPSDRFGAALALQGDLAVIGTPEDDDRGADSGSAYVFRLVGATWVETQKLVASDGSTSDNFGRNVVTDGTRIAIGSLRGGVGGVYLFEQVAGQWIETQILTPADVVPGDWYGFGIALDGDDLLVGAPQQRFGQGSVYAFQRQAGAFLQTQKIEPVGGAGLAWFGFVLDMDSGRFVSGNVSPESVLSFQKIGTNWVEEQRFTGPDTKSGEAFGAEIFVEGDQLMISAPRHVHPGYTGRTPTAYLYERGVNGWVFADEVLPPLLDVTRNATWQTAFANDRVVIGPFIHERNPLGQWSSTRRLASVGFPVVMDGDTLLRGFRSPPSTPDFARFSDLAGVGLGSRGGVVWRSGSVETLTACGGAPGGPLIIVAVEANSTPIFQPVLSGTFLTGGRWNYQATVPPGLRFSRVLLRAYGVRMDGQVDESNEVGILFL